MNCLRGLPRIWMVVGAACLLAACGGGGGSGDDTAAACPDAVPIAPDGVVNASLSASDCTVSRLFPSLADDESLVDRYIVTLPTKGRLTIDMSSAEIDSFLVLTTSPPSLPEIASDDDSGAGFDARLIVRLAAGEYIIFANSAGLSRETGRYTLTTSFEPELWSTTSTVGAPSARLFHSAVWSGSKMIVWGGDNGNAITTQSGGRYDPASDTWTPTTLVGAPPARTQHQSVWAGDQKIVWGGLSGAPSFDVLAGGGRYFPASDSWMPMTTANQPSARFGHTAIWTGTEMIVWGGFSCTGGCAGSDLDTGGRYNPVTDEWTPVSLAGAPAARGNHSAIWTGSRMIVWGGQINGGPGLPLLLNSGGIYDPLTDTWTSTTLMSAPAAMRCQGAVWSGSGMIVFGGQTGNLSSDCHIQSSDQVGRYDPASDSWLPTSVAPVSSTLSGVQVVWSGDEMITWFDNIGARYNPVNDTWRGITTVNAPSSRRRHSLVWTGSSLIVWGGDFAGPLNTGGIYRPRFDPTP